MHTTSDRDHRRDYPILYVDDEEPNRIVFEAAFGDEFRIDCAASAEEALRALAERPIAVVLADQRMPGMTGIELCEVVRERHPAVLRVLVTAHSDQATAIEAINRGGVARYLAKPWTESDVRQMLREAVERVHLETTVRSLRTAILERERAGILSAMRARVLHDLANLDMVVAESCATLGNLMEPLRAALSPALFAEVESSVARLRTAVDHITDLHLRRTRSAPLAPGSREFLRVRDVLDSVRELVRADVAGLACLSFACPDDAVIFADRTDVVRILMNLITNALQAIDEAAVPHGEIRVAVADLDGAVAIDVCDNGPGVAPDAAERMFEPAFTTRTASGGSGLGLAICRELAHANEGTVAWRPPPDGRPAPTGACFRVTLPVVP